MILWKYMHLVCWELWLHKYHLRSTRNHHVYVTNLVWQNKQLVTYHHTMLKVIIQRELWIMFKDH
ncbi:431L [Invertebrate iridescent virus 6]|uniref:431L n=1 Tax=Invertebrate iridescent virus 6 TaxID=176652 RepID=Q91F94_IIV6|nr:431L [Invertebrate iridescent virus 6]AAK82291.1 431L [Invertebrate iridescent virus 6]QMS79434.1 hypothetical protein IIV6-T1_423 [Invertebrate iridescent virus 6]